MSLENFLYEKPFRSVVGQMGKVINNKEEFLVITTPLMSIVEIQKDFIILRNDSVDFTNWLKKLEKINSAWFKHYLPKNKQFQTDINSIFKVSFQSTSSFFELKDDKTYISSPMSFNKGEKCKLLINTTGIWVNKEHYGNTWYIKQAIVLRQ